jgi:O-antigen/teichoic acid export membrane protein
VFCAIILLFSEQLEILLLFKLNFQLIGLFFCFFQIFYNVILEFYRLEERALEYGMLTATWIITNLLLTLIFCVKLDYGWEGRVFVQLFVSIPFFIYSLFILYKRAYIYFGIPPRAHFKELLNFGVPLIPHNSSVWMRQGLDRYFINFYYGAAVVGSYSLAYNFAGLIMMLGTAFNSSNSVFIYKALREDNDETKSKLIRLTLYSILFFLISTLVAIISIFLFIKYLAPKYNDAIPFIIPLCLMGFFQCLYYLFVNYLFYYSKTKGLMLITFGVSLLHVLLAFLLVKYSSLFLAYIGLFSTFLICILVVIYSNKIYPFIKKKHDII